MLFMLSTADQIRNETKADVLNPFFTSVFTDKTDLLLS